MSEDFEGRKLLVVGGSSGIGLATAEKVIAGGGSAVITGRNPEKLQAAVEALSKHGKAWGVAAELTDRTQIPEVRKRIEACRRHLARQRGRNIRAQTLHRV